MVASEVDDIEEEELTPPTPKVLEHLPRRLLGLVSWAANMPVCCRCNGSGRCKACSCVKSGTPCVDCLPSRNGHCSNLAEPSPNGPERPTLAPAYSVHSDTNSNVDNRRDEDAAPDFDVSIHDTSTQPTTPPMVREGRNTVYSLPPVEPMSEPNYHWNDIAGPEFTKVIEDAYNQIVHWKPNIFRIPSGSSGKKFVSELAQLFQAFADASALESVALKAAMTLPALVLQKPHAKSKVREHISCLDRRRASLHKFGTRTTQLPAQPFNGSEDGGTCLTKLAHDTVTFRMVLKRMYWSKRIMSRQQMNYSKTRQ